MAALTPNYEFNLPEEGADTDLWGGLLNENWAALDTTLQSMQQQITDAIEAFRIKVGDLYFSTDADDPATKLGYGTWVAHAAGRAIVGVGSNGTSVWAVNETRGAETHPLSAGEMPAHSHPVNPPLYTNTTVVGGAHSHDGGYFGFPTLSGGSPTTFQSQAGSLHRSGAAVPVSGAHAHTFQVDIPQFNSGSSGSGTAHNNIQPSIGVYVWKRTA